MRAPSSPVSALSSALFAAFAGSGCTAYQPAVVAQDAPIAATEAVATVPEPLRLDRAHDAPASVAGTIRDDAGQPLAGARVCAWNVDRHADDLAPRCVETDAAGGYALAGLVPARHEVHASAAQRQPIEHIEQLALRPGERREGVDLQLVPGGAALQGVVRDVRGRAIAGAWVTNRDPVVRDMNRRRGAAAATLTDADGRFTLWVSPGPQDLVAGADGFVSAGAVDGAAPGRYTVELEPESTLVGRVVDVRGEPVAGARVSALSAMTQLRAGLAYTDADGRYRVAGLPAGRYRARAEAPGRRGEGPWTVFLGLAAASASQTITLRPAVSLAARLVVTGSSQTCALGRVTLHGPDGVTQTELAGPDGEVYFAAVQPGVHHVQAECPGAVPPPELPPLEVHDTPVRGVVWQFAVGRSLAGVIADAGGRPLIGVGVHVQAVARDCGADCATTTVARGSGRSHCQTDDQCAMDEICDNGSCVFSGIAGGSFSVAPLSDAHGRFRVTGLAPGSYEVSAAGAEPSARVRVELTERDVGDVRLVAATQGQLGGVVVDERGAPVVGAVVDVLADRGYLSAVLATRTDDDGRFTAFDLKPGDYRVRARALVQSGDADTSQPLPGDVRTRVDLRAPAELALTLPTAPGKIRGRLRGPDGAPVPDLLVRARREHADGSPSQALEEIYMGAVDRSARADAVGVFTLTGLAPGTYTLSTSRGEGVGEAFVEHVQVGGDVALTLPTPVTIAGRLGGTPPESFTVRLHGQDNDVAYTDTFVATGGRWVFEGLTAGRYELHCEGPVERGLLVVAVGERPLDALELPMAVPGGVRGRVLDAESRTPLAGVQVTVATDGPAVRFPGWTQELMTDDDGRFEFSGLPPGPTRITFPAYEPGTLDTTVEPGRTAEVWPTLRLAAGRAAPVLPRGL